MCLPVVLGAAVGFVYYIYIYLDQKLLRKPTIWLIWQRVLWQPSQRTLSPSRRFAFLCLELVDVRRLKLQQFIQLFTCESDAQQIGSDQDDLKCLREDRMKLEETARSTYEYGKQLCQVALVLRRSLRMDAQNQIGLNDKLEHTWGHLCRALSENEAKLNVTEAFNTTIVEVNRRIQELDCKLKESLNARRPSLGHSSTVERLFSVERRRLTGDIQELRHIADMLTAQINANHRLTIYIYIYISETFCIHESFPMALNNRRKRQSSVSQYTVRLYSKVLSLGCVMACNKGISTKVASVSKVKMHKESYIPITSKCFRELLEDCPTTATVRKR
uniref:Uncharacterized protein n=1 Tax=Heterorhabditis bacteriophora TaxID=37862 RepID=A0A1I7WND4_HETBA